MSKHPYTYEKRYPHFKTMSCVSCKCLVEVRIDNFKMSRGKCYCGKPCTPAKNYVCPRPAVVKVYKTGRVDMSEYELALRKHKGLEVL